MNLELLCNSVISTAQKAADFIKEEGKTFTKDKVEFKGSKKDLVSYVDKEAEKLIVKELEILLPEAGFITEEETISKKGDRYQWVIDPLDGTTNFMHQITPHCVSIGLMDGTEIVLGVIIEITKNETFSAWKNGGAWKDGKKLTISQEIQIEDSLIVTGFPYSMGDKTDNYINILKDLIQRSKGIRRLGSAAADMALVAEGKFDCFYEFNINLWDVAAGIILVKEAGGTCSDFSGNTDFTQINKVQMVASGKCHLEVLKTIQKYW